jgi:gamma-glutamyl hydrolase
MFAADGYSNEEVRNNTASSSHIGSLVEWTMARLLSIAAAVLAFSLATLVEARGPIIGIVSHPIAKHGEYISASYVKWVEMGGGRVVPIPYNAPKEYLQSLVPQLNGILFMGGAADVNDAHRYIYQLAIELNDKGVYYPVWGTCLGFEWLLQITAQDPKALNGGLDSENITLPLNFTSLAPQSKLFNTMGKQMYSWLAEKPITLNNHQQGMTPQRFAEYPKLTEFYNILSTNFDRQGVEFISAFEAKKYPIYAVQFHPEKNSFEYGEYADGSPYEVIDHSYEAIFTSQFFANYFINEARKNDLKFEDSKTQKKALIYNYQTSTFTDPGFVESYIFKHDAPKTYWVVE